MKAPAQERFIFTVATGRCGQSSLTELVQHHVPHCYPAFEEPNIHPLLPAMFEAYERRFRRRFVETNELLGRGKVLSAYESGDHAYIASIAAKRLRTIRRTLTKTHSSIYFDISKFFARGLHAGFLPAVGRYALVNLVRDPLRNMRSFVNRAKNFRLDNSMPDARSNILRLSPDGMEVGELYLWAWCELSLRFHEMRQAPGVSHAVEIHTEHLVDAVKMNAAFDALELPHTPVVSRPARNTNAGQGLPETRVNAQDIALFERFLSRIPAPLLDRIGYLKDYDPWTVHKLDKASSHASAVH